MESAVSQDATGGGAAEVAGTPVIELACLTIAECTPVADQIRQHLLNSSRVEIRWSACEEIDTAGLQLLTILRCDEGVASRIVFDTPSETVQRALTLLGMAALFAADPVTA